MLAAFRGDALYDTVLFLHILAAIVGFGSTFVWPYLAAQARQQGPETSLAAARISNKGGKILSTYPIYGVGVTGILLVLVSDGLIEWSATWISIAFLLYFVALVVSHFLHYPNLDAMLELQEELATAGPPPQSGGAAAGGPPPQVLELQERGQKAGIYGGILHVLFALTLLDMVFKPGG